MNLRVLYKKIQSYSVYMYVYLCLYATLSYLFLTRFPLVHSDESWLAGMTDAYLDNKSIFVTESFFDLMPRTVHTIKSLYHLIQLPFVTFFGYSIHSVRLPSLIVGILSLLVFYKLLNKLTQHSPISFVMTLLLSLNLQFVYASHFARQEIFLFFVLILAYYLYISYPKKTYLASLLVGISIALHPNAFIIGTMLGLVQLKDTFLKKRSLKNLIHYVLILLGFALFHLGLSLSANPDFFQQYLDYGRTFNVDAAPLLRLQNFIDFYLKLYYQVTGTYYIPPMKVVVYLYLGSLVLMLLIYITYKKSMLSPHISCGQKFKTWQTKFIDPILMVIAFSISVYIIGRYNTTSILFLIFPIYLTFAYVLLYLLDRQEEWLRHVFVADKTSLFGRKVSLNAIFILFCTLLVVISFNSLQNEVTKISSQDYSNYLHEINTAIDDDSVILGNLSSGFIFYDHVFFDIRNLAYLGDMSIEDYIKTRQIDTIIYYEEYDYIERNPQWTILYGDTFHPSELKAFLMKKATLKHTFTDMYYGSRIIDYMGDYPWKIYIYTINHD